MKRVFLVIDGGNFYRKLKRLGFTSLLEFNYRGFVRWLARNDKLTEYGYYVGQIREEPGSTKSKMLKRDQDRLFTQLRQQGFFIKTGYILKSDGSYTEKGVDVQIAVDICMKAVRNEYDKLILVSSDTDLIPAMREVINSGKIGEYVGFDINPSFAMMRFSSSRTLLKKEDFIPFIKKVKLNSKKDPARKRTG